MAIAEIGMQGRSSTGKSGVRKIRAKGLTPGVFYGPLVKEAVSVAFSPTELRKILRGHTWAATLLRIKSDDNKLNGKTVRLKAWDVHPLTRDWRHVDFMEVDLSKKMEVKVPLHFIGKAKGLTEGGLLQPIHREIEMLVNPTAIPEFVEVDVSEVTAQHPLHFKDIKLPADCELSSDPDDAVVTITTIAEEEAAPVAAAAEGAAATAEGAAAAAPAEGGAAAPAAPGAAPAKGAKPAGGKGEGKA